MKKLKKEEQVIVVEPADDPDFGTSMLNTKEWDRIVITTKDGKKVAEIDGDDATPATGYLVNLYPKIN